jgi:hypothetical protein
MNTDSENETFIFNLIAFRNFLMWKSTFVFRVEFEHFLSVLICVHLWLVWNFF